MLDAFEFSQGQSPLLISMPHVGTELTDEVATKLTDAARLLPDTDWHLPRLYQQAAQFQPSLIRANYSRYVIDLNRPQDNAPLYQGATTGLFSQTLFSGEPMWHSPVSEPQHQWAIESIWQPYYQQIEDELARIKAHFGYALLFDAHSIASEIPYLFAGRLPDLNLGSNQGMSCDPALVQSLSQVCEDSDYSWVHNGRFKGGFITRHFGRPEQQLHAIQLEMAQAIYMDEQPPFTYREALAAPVSAVIMQMLKAYLEAAASLYE
ncbi:N-formylglutamate deformylase [Celerinatantimonas sp. YJH-8]|uniref:N-formylglutamate deformylase n=1 Tax=Celerinatantimonas sp. YJH-8 TaxID=3228714 RepID=UPI0038C97E1B